VPLRSCRTGHYARWRRISNQRAESSEHCQRFTGAGLPIQQATPASTQDEALRIHWGLVLATGALPCHTGDSQWCDPHTFLPTFLCVMRLDHKPPSRFVAWRICHHTRSGLGLSLSERNLHESHKTAAQSRTRTIQRLKVRLSVRVHGHLKVHICRAGRTKCLCVLCCEMLCDHAHRACFRSSRWSYDADYYSYPNPN
jgi:hypothetical protein